MPKLDAERLRQKREKLEAELEALRAAELSADEKRNAIAGRVVLAHADKNAAFGEELMRILDAYLTKRGERALFGLTVPERRQRPSATAEAKLAAALPPAITPPDERTT